MIESFEKSRVLVAGGAGFLGSHLCTTLLDQGHEVICVDNFYSGSKANIADLIGNKNFEILRHDVCLPLFVECDRIFNLACPASPIAYQKDPVQTVKTNVSGAINLLGLAKRLGVPVLQASTSEVYGDPEISPQSESYWGRVNPIGVRSCYDEGKRCAETLFFDYHRQHNLDVKVVRIFNTYGPKMKKDDGRVVSNFINQALDGKPLTIFGDGSQTRSFCYVDDLIAGLIAMIDSTSSCVGPINLGNPIELSMAQLAAKIIELTGSRSEIRLSPLPEDDPLQRRPDIRKAKHLLGWEPVVGLEEGLLKTIEFFEQIRH